MMELLMQAIHAIGLAALPCVVAWVGAHVKNAFAAQAIDRAVQRAGGIAYHYMAARAGGMPAAQARVQAIEVSTDYVMRAVPGILTHLGVTNATVRDMVTGELGKLFAADPNISAVSAPIPVPVPMVPQRQPPPAIPPPPAAETAATAPQNYPDPVAPPGASPMPAAF
jgi:hypothetical protein